MTHPEPSPTEPIVKAANAESRTTTAPRELVWNAWTDISTWTQWMSMIAEAGPPQILKEGSVAYIKVPGKPRQRVVVTHVTHLRKIDLEYSRFLARVVLSRTLSQRSDGETVFVHAWEIRGLLAPLYRRLSGQHLHASLAMSLDGLKRYVEKQI